MRRRAMTESHPSSSDSNSRAMPFAVYSHVSTYRAAQLELQLYSPSLRVDTRGPLAVFNDHDKLSGKVVLDSLAHHTGRLVLTVEGCFSYPPLPGHSPYSEPRKHVFCTLSKAIDVSPPIPESRGFTFRDAFMMRRPSASYLNAQAVLTERTYPFELALPQGCRPGEELPPSFSSTSAEGNPFAASCEVSYKVVVAWYPETILQTPSHLEVPIVIQGDSDFESKDAGLGASGDSWVEMPLKTERPLPVKFAIALPTSVTFCRDSSIPYFVVFSTTPKAPLLAREIASDSTISIALIRQIAIQQPQSTFLLTPPPSPVKESPVRMLRRVARSNPRLKRKRSEFEEEFAQKPLPDLPFQTCYSETKTVFSDFFIGFSKRPRHHCEPGSHPSLEAQTSLPDGLHKGKIPLHKDMLPCIDWAGVSVKYYLDVSVLNGIDDMRARIPVRIY
ncbi:hypothetical protein D9611_007194 [Ephemerocybe angulata]|uniref:Uncharacterized protein n=1 Tax=Ephemerocybe angulata TaxID=980116 RepID=A0A8H5EW45_9AGAR|nr:hypothetical protein D9611_007194 [Tulosesus angulatus]